MWTHWPARPASPPRSLPSRAKTTTAAWQEGGIDRGALSKLVVGEANSERLKQLEAAPWAFWAWWSCMEALSLVAGHTDLRRPIIKDTCISEYITGIGTAKTKTVHGW